MHDQRSATLAANATLPGRPLAVFDALFADDSTFRRDTVRQEVGYFICPDKVTDAGSVSKLSGVACCHRYELQFTMYIYPNPGWHNPSHVLA